MWVSPDLEALPHFVWFPWCRTSYFAVGRYGFDVLRRASKARLGTVGTRSYYEDVERFYEAVLADFAAEHDDLVMEPWA